MFVAGTDQCQQSREEGEEKYANNGQQGKTRYDAQSDNLYVRVVCRRPVIKDLCNALQDAVDEVNCPISFSYVVVVFLGSCVGKMFLPWQSEPRLVFVF